VVPDTGGLLSPFVVNVGTGDDLRSDPRLREEIETLLEPSYISTKDLLAREYAHCDTIYTARTLDCRLAGFFMAAWEPIPNADQPIPAAYMGLVATHPDARRMGIVRALFSRFIVDVMAREQVFEERLLLWVTTATPLVFRALAASFVEVEPLADGSFSPEGSALIAAIRKYLGRPAEPGSHPFVLHGIAEGTRYSPREAIRIGEISSESGFNLFERLDIVEDRGDRLVLVCRAPHVPRH